MLESLSKYIIVINFLVWIFYFLIVLPERRKPDRALTWLLVFVLIPWLAPFIYMAIGLGINRIRIINQIKNSNHSIDKSINKRLRILKDKIPTKTLQGNKTTINLIENITPNSTSNHNQVQVLIDREMHPAVAEAIQKAKKFIHIDYYQVESGEIGDMIFPLLKEKARQGVKVRFIYDPIGAQINDHDMATMLDAGVELVKFIKLSTRIKKRLFNFYNHRKIILIDNETAFLGGHNLADECYGLSKYYGYWRDTSIKIKGPAVNNISHIFFRDWYFATGKKSYDWKKYLPKQKKSGQTTLQIVTAGPDSEFESIRKIYFDAIASAQEKIYIASPYFVPDDSILVALRTAALSGQDVRLILPRKSNTTFTYYANMSYIELLIEAGVKVYIYDPKKYLHSKIILIDGKFASVGSANLDMRSMFINYEINACIYNTKITTQLEKQFMQDLKSSKLLDKSFYENKSQARKIIEAIARLFTPLL